jgi:hypothetical protein
LLPSNLLRARISRGKIRPLYVDLDASTLALAERIKEIYSSGVGKKKGGLLERLRKVEDEGHDFKLVRGLSTLLERRCTFQAESAVDPMRARMAVFEEASVARVATHEQRAEVLERVSTRLGVPTQALEGALYSDIEDELLLREFRPIPCDGLLRLYNLSLTQTLLFKSLRFEFSASGGWQRIFREVKRLGLIYSVESEGEGQGAKGYRVAVDGPLSLFKMTERYGTSIAKLLPLITASTPWRIQAEILARSRGGRVYTFEADSEELRDTLAVGDASDLDDRKPTYDSSVEERFAKSFLSCGSGWMLRREPEPLIAGRHVLIPDFSLERDGAKVYVEVVGFWTPEYLKRKIDKLSSVAGVDMVIAADESLACSKLDRLKGRATVIYYKGHIPLKPLLNHLKEREASVLKAQADGLKAQPVVLEGDVVKLADIAKTKGVSLESLRLALTSFEPEEYSRAGDLFISKARLEEIDKKIAGVEKLVDALRIMGSFGVAAEDGQKVLEALGYTTSWEGIEMENVRIKRPPVRADDATTNTNPGHSQQT